MTHAYLRDVYALYYLKLWEVFGGPMKPLNEFIAEARLRETTLDMEC
jgi:hypothetical protein